MVKRNIKVPKHIAGHVCLFFYFMPFNKNPAWLFQNGVFTTNQLNLLIKPIYIILKQPLNLTLLGHSKKRDTHALNFDVTVGICVT